MATIKEEFEALKIRINKGEGNEIIHIVDHAKERQRKKNNPDKSTKMILNCRSPELWTKMQMAKERYMVLAVDPGLAIEMMVWALNRIDDAALRARLEEGHAQPGDAEPGPAPAKAEIPSWLK